MTMIEMNGFDLRDLTVRSGWSSVGGATNTSTPFSAGSSWQFSGSTSQTATCRFNAVNQLIAGFACVVAAGGSTHFGMTFLGDLGATQHLTLVVSNTGTITVYRGAEGGTVLASYAAAMNDGNWHYLEMTGTIDSVAGTLEVRLNGLVVISFTGNTKNGGTNSTIDTFRVGTLSTGVGGTCLVDDLYLCDTTGSRNNSYLGPWFRVQTLKPSAAGSSTQFTPVSGSNFSNVNDVPDNTATYNSDTVSGHRDTFTMDDLTAGTTTVLAVSQHMHARQLDGGTATIKHAQKSGATISYGATKTLSASNADYSDIFEINPATSAAWTSSDVNALEAGYEIV